MGPPRNARVLPETCPDGLGHSKSKYKYGGGSLAFTEVYDPATNAWSSASLMATARYNHTATLLSTGKVLVAGGYGSGNLASTETYTH